MQIQQQCRWSSSRPEPRGSEHFHDCCTITKDGHIVSWDSTVSARSVTSLALLPRIPSVFEAKNGRRTCADNDAMPLICADRFSKQHHRHKGSAHDPSIHDSRDLIRLYVSQDHISGHIGDEIKRRGDEQSPGGGELDRTSSPCKNKRS